MKNLLYIITDLNGGGAERVLLDTVRKLKYDYQITVLSLFNEGVYLSEIRDEVNYFYLYDMPNNFILRRVKRFICLRYLKYFSVEKGINSIFNYQFDIEIAYLEGIPTKILSERTSKSKKIAWVHIDPIAMPYSTKYFINTTMEEKAYSNMDNIICVSTSVKDSFISKYGNIDEKKVKFIENIYDFSNIMTKSEEQSTVHFDEKCFNVILVGKLMKQKGYDRLIEAIKDQISHKSKLRFHILGDGPEKTFLVKLIERYNIGEIVSLHGYQNNPYSIMRKADLFMSTSLTEGYSTVTVEAIVLGLPVLVTDCSGMRDIIGDSQYGMLVSNSLSGVKNAIYQLEHIAPQYENLRRKSENRRQFYMSDIGIDKLNNLFLID